MWTEQIWKDITELDTNVFVHHKKPSKHFLDSCNSFPHYAHHLSVSSWLESFGSTVDINKGKTKHIHSICHSLNLMAIMS